MMMSHGRFAVTLLLALGLALHSVSGQSGSGTSGSGRVTSGSGTGSGGGVGGCSPFIFDTSDLFGSGTSFNGSGGKSY